MRENSILKKLKPKFREKLDQSINNCIKKYKDSQQEHRKIFLRKIDTLRNIFEYLDICEAYNFHVKSKSQHPLKFRDLELSDIEITNDDFDTWKNKYIEVLREKITTCKENINKPDIALKRLENNKKAWLEFLQIEDN